MRSSASLCPPGGVSLAQIAGSTAAPPRVENAGQSDPPRSVVPPGRHVLRLVNTTAPLGAAETRSAVLAPRSRTRHADPMNRGLGCHVERTDGESEGGLK